ncbi:unnamed protein product [Arabis nemorensis]|uniref:UDP-glycosyltransferases domain-containing protein n=1 Tax=Arabis nemorensis TaxID=586526 RepID=A0A565BZX2_9BRAS|nr:unnamed protein product [Arabis nemorensis]
MFLTRLKTGKTTDTNGFYTTPREPNAIKALQEPGFDNPPVCPIGPLVNNGNQEGNRVEPGGTLTCEQLNELALGLVDSEQRFLWVIRSPSGAANSSFFNSHSHTDPLTFLPPDFLERTKDKGFVIPSWAPQAEVLAHPSTGGFLNHCGWNSTLENISVALRARAGDDGVVRREEVARVVKGLMEGEEGKRVRNKMKMMKEGACRVLTDDGSSTKALSQLVL